MYKHIISFSFLALTALTTLTLASCKTEGCTDEAATNYNPEANKEDGSCEYPPENQVEVSVSSPETGDMFMAGDTIMIHATITSTEEIHGYTLVLENTTTSTVIMDIEEHAHDLTTHIHEMWVNNVTGHTDMKLTVTAIIDHEGTEVSETVSFHCHPM